MYNQILTDLTFGVLMMPRKRVRRYSTIEVAEILGVSRQTVVYWIHKGRLRAERTPGGHYRIPEYELKKIKNRTSKKRR